MMQEKFMKVAIDLAKKAAIKDEVPVGCVIVKDGKIIAKAHNKKEQKKCANYHAEIVAIEKACKKIGDWRLIGCDVYVTLEPCAMCSGALVNARVDNIYFGAYDKKAGCLESVYKFMEDGKFNHKAHVEGGILEEENIKILQDYFKTKRGVKC